MISEAAWLAYVALAELLAQYHANPYHLLLRKDGSGGVASRFAFDLEVLLVEWKQPWEAIYELQRGYQATLRKIKDEKWMSLAERAQRAAFVATISSRDGNDYDYIENGIRYPVRVLEVKEERARIRFLTGTYAPPHAVDDAVSQQVFDEVSVWSLYPAEKPSEK